MATIAGTISQHHLIPRHGCRSLPSTSCAQRCIPTPRPIQAMLTTARPAGRQLPGDGGSDEAGHDEGQGDVVQRGGEQIDAGVVDGASSGAVTEKICAAAQLSALERSGCVMTPTAADVSIGHPGCVAATLVTWGAFCVRHRLGFAQPVLTPGPHSPRHAALRRARRPLARRSASAWRSSAAWPSASACARRAACSPSTAAAA